MLLGWLAYYLGERVTMKNLIAFKFCGFQLSDVIVLKQD